MNYKNDLRAMGTLETRKNIILLWATLWIKLGKSIAKVWWVLVFIRIDLSNNSSFMRENHLKLGKSTRHGQKCFQYINVQVLFFYLYQTMNNVKFIAHFIISLWHMFYTHIMLTHVPLVLHICVSESGQHWFRLWLVAYLAPSLYLN